MTDYFALLEQPRRPWLDPDELKQSFHAKTLQAHPDAQLTVAASDGGAAFSQINEAYQVLRDSKRRVHHLLQLEGAEAERNATVPSEIAELFPSVAALTQQADAVMQKAAAATTALSRSLVKAELLATFAAISEMLERLQQLNNDATLTLQEADKSWGADAKAQLPNLQRLYLQFSYGSRWIAELNEKQARLAGAA